MTAKKENQAYRSGGTERVFSQIKEAVLEMSHLHQRGRFYGMAEAGGRGNTDSGLSGREAGGRLRYCFPLPEVMREKAGRRISGPGWPAGMEAALAPGEWEKTQKESVIPVETYMGRDVTGPWSDVYSLCAVLYGRLTGMAPVSARERILGAVLEPPSRLGVRISRNREEALMKGLELLPKDRWQNGRELYEAMFPAEDDSRRKCQRKHNVLKKQTGSVFSDHVYMLGTGIRCSEILSVTFLDFLNDMPRQRWDVSEKGNYSVMAWAEEQSGGYDFYIAGEGGVAANPDSRGLFQDCYRMKRIDFQDCLDTSEVKNMSAMFYNCASLTELDLSGFDTGNVTDMSDMFYNCSSLKRLEVTGFNTGKVTDMSRMFFGCRELRELDISGFDRRNVRNAEEMLKKTRWQ